MPNYNYTRVERPTYPPYDIQQLNSNAAMNLARACDGIHITIPPAHDIRNGQAWSYPHITFEHEDGHNEHIYIGWTSTGNRIPVNSGGYRIRLSAGEWTLFQNIVADMREIYDYV